MSQSSNSEAATSVTPLPSLASLIDAVEKGQKKTTIPTFRAGDSVKVHAKIREGGKERIQIFEGVVIRRHQASRSNATFTVRKISYNIGVERTFFLHSPMIERIEIVSVGDVRRARLFYLRGLRGKSARIKSQLVSPSEDHGTPAETKTEAAAQTAETTVQS